MSRDKNVESAATSEGFLQKASDTSPSDGFGPGPDVAPRQKVTSSPSISVDPRARSFADASRLEPLTTSSPMSALLLVQRRRLVALRPRLCDPRGGGHRVTQLTP